MVGTAIPDEGVAALLELRQRDALAAIDMVNMLSNSTHRGQTVAPRPGHLDAWQQPRAWRGACRRGYAGGNLFLEDFTACDAYAGLEAAARKVTCPVTLVLGGRDQMTSPQSVAPIVAALKPRVVTLPVGHNLMAEDPDGVLKAIDSALSARCTA